MFPSMQYRPHASISFPRVCGDVSSSKLLQKSVPWFSPRMRGCFSATFYLVDYFMVFPAYAGMFPSANYPKQDDLGFPRVCGDVSKLFSTKRSTRKFSPRMRGCFSNSFSWWSRYSVFPAYAGMFPMRTVKDRSRNRFPRVCGDVSTSRLITMGMVQFSPRMRGCFYQ